MMRTTASCCLLGALVLLVASEAGAQEARERPEAPRSAAGLRGLEVMIRPTVGGAPGDSPVRFAPQPGARVAGDFGDLLGGRAAPYGPGFVGQAFVGYRFHPLVSGGFRAGLRTASASAIGDGSTNLSRSSWDAGFYVRAYPLALNERMRSFVDPWVSVGVTYMRDLQRFQRPAGTTTGQTVVADATIDHHAVAVPLGLGIDFRVHPMFSVGPSFELAIANAVAGCAKQTAAGFSTVSYCSVEGAGKDFIRADTYAVWSAGVDAKVTF